MLASNGAADCSRTALRDGKYKIRIHAAATQAGDEDRENGTADQRTECARIRSQRGSEPDWYEHEVTLAAGSHAIGGAFLNDFYNPNDPEESRRDRNLAIQSIEVIGPEGGGDTRMARNASTIRHCATIGNRLRQGCGGTGDCVRFCIARFVAR